jgi:hypothetical protein
MAFGIPADYQTRRRNDHASFYCPSGHAQSYQGKSEAEQLRAQLAEKDAAIEAERRSRKWAEDRAKGANISAGMARAAHRRLSDRVSHGVCPCCQRTFKQLAAHMKAKHPEHVKASK